MQVKQFIPCNIMFMSADNMTLPSSPLLMTSRWPRRGSRGSGTDSPLDWWSLLLSIIVQVEWFSSQVAGYAAHALYSSDTSVTSTFSENDKDIIYSPNV